MEHNLLIYLHSEIQVSISVKKYITVKKLHEYVAKIIKTHNFTMYFNKMCLNDNLLKSIDLNGNNAIYICKDYFRAPFPQFSCFERLPRMIVHDLPEMPDMYLSSVYFCITECEYNRENILLHKSQITSLLRNKKSKETNPLEGISNFYKTQVLVINKADLCVAVYGKEFHQRIYIAMYESNFFPLILYNRYQRKTIFLNFEYTLKLALKAVQSKYF